MRVYTNYLQYITWLFLISVNSLAVLHETEVSHPAGMACNDCHLAGQRISPANAYLLTDTQQQLCAKCHDDMTGFSHPTGFQPRGILPAEFPLSGQNKFTCSTCHDVHGKSRNYLRIDKRGKEFCLLCHNRNFLRS
jgi:predicted CXXCH cytochrome family protein